MNDPITVLTERGQVSIPASIRREAGLKPGQSLRWEQLSDNEIRITVDRHSQARGAFAALGYAKPWLSTGGLAHTNDVMRDLRDGEEG
jgi:AbrB family looped-hinge helix DNA binding protein